MATTHSPLPSPLPSSPSTNPLPPLNTVGTGGYDHPALSRLRERASPASPNSGTAGTGPLERNSSTSSSRSTTTTSSTTSSLVAVPIRPPPKETRTAATTTGDNGYGSSSGGEGSQRGPEGGRGLKITGRESRGDHHPGRSVSPDEISGRAANYHIPEGIYGGRSFQRNGPRSATATPSRSRPSTGTSSRNGGTDTGGGNYGLTSSTSLPAQPYSGGRFGVPLPAIVTVDTTPTRSGSVPVQYGYNSGQGISPTTPRAGRFTRPEESEEGLRPMINGIGGSPVQGRVRALTADPGRSGSKEGGERGKNRTMSAGMGNRDQSNERERRQSAVSAKSSNSAGAGGRVRETTADYVFGEELGRGSYSTVVQAVRSSTSSSTSPTSPRPTRAPRQYAIKIINQAHLIQERKTKYAMIERDALVRLNAPRSGVAGGGMSASTSGRGHRRGMSGSSITTPSNLGNGAPTSTAPRKNRSTASLTGLSAQIQQSSNRRDSIAPGGDRLSVFSDTSSTSTYTAGTAAPPLSSPTLSASGSSSMFFTSASPGRRPSRSADPPEVVPERSEDGHEATEVIVRSRPPSPVKEEGEGLTTPEQKTEVAKLQDPVEIPGGGGATDEHKGKRRSNDGPRTSGEMEDKLAGGRSRRASKAPSERSTRSAGSKGAHQGIIRLYSTFNDATSLYFVLELAGKGELLTYLRKYGSFDIESARYYSALVLDTIEFMHERGVIHRDLKPENILLDEDMRIKITDFGSAKLLNKDGRDPKDEEENKKRSFVGSADFVSPEVLRNEPAVAASDIWAFGCIVYQLIVGKPPFRGATDYLTFQKILKNEMEFPEGFDAEAKSLIENILNLDPSSRPSPQDLKDHPFFSAIDWSTVWQGPVPTMSTGITPPVATLATVDPASDIWAVFEDEYSDTGGDMDDADDPRIRPSHSRLASTNRQATPRYDGQTAAQAVWAVDSPDAHPPLTNPLDQSTTEDDLEPPRPAWVTPPAGGGNGKRRGLSRGSARTSSSSSNNRTALTGFLESMGIVQPGSGRTSRMSDKSDESRATGNGGVGSASSRVASPRAPTSDKSEKVDIARWNQLLLNNETIIFTSPISIRTTTNTLPSFLFSGSTKRRQLILTDFPRLLTVKEESPSTAIQSASSLSAASQASLSVKNEYVFVVRGSTGSAGGGAGGANRVTEVLEKGPKGFTIQTASQSMAYIADTAEVRNEWMNAIKGVVG